MNEPAPLRWLTDCKSPRGVTFDPLPPTDFKSPRAAGAQLCQHPSSASRSQSPGLKPIVPTIDLGVTSMRNARSRFIGWNDLGLELYSPKHGCCRDGLHVDRVNLNQERNQTVGLLLSLAEMRCGKYAGELLRTDRRLK